MKTISDDENERLMHELTAILIPICREYSISQVSSATFSIMLTAIYDTPVVAERLHVLNTIMAEVSDLHNTLLLETKKPSKLKLH